tara:strand:- start:6243 stop:6554 length:312 start_codon:yes stop_codon:yes gene_type:complete
MGTVPTDYPPGVGPVIKGVGVMELNIKLGGAIPQVFYGIAYLDGGGQTMGQVRCNTITPTAQRLLDAFVAQLETDFVEVSGTELHDPESLMTTSSDSLRYPAP